MHESVVNEIIFYACCKFVPARKFCKRMDVFVFVGVFCDCVYVFVRVSTFCACMKVL